MCRKCRWPRSKNWFCLFYEKWILKKVGVVNKVTLGKNKVRKILRAGPWWVKKEKWIWKIKKEFFPLFQGHSEKIAVFYGASACWNYFFGCLLHGTVMTINFLLAPSLCNGARETSVIEEEQRHSNTHNCFCRRRLAYRHLNCFFSRVKWRQL